MSRIAICKEVWIVFLCISILVMSTYFRCRLLHFCVMSLLYVLLINGATILFWVRTICIFFSTNVRWSDFQPPGSWWLDFWNFSFGTSVRQSDVEPPVPWRLDFGTLVSWLIKGLVSPSLRLIIPRGGKNLRLWLALWRNSWLIAVRWLGGWCLVN